MKRSSTPALSDSGEAALSDYARFLVAEEDLSPATVRNYLSDLRQFAAWYERNGEEEVRNEAGVAGGNEAGVAGVAAFAPDSITTPTLTRYRGYLQEERKLRAASVNRSLISLKGYCAWAVEMGRIGRDPARPVKLVASEPQPPCSANRPS